MPILRWACGGLTAASMGGLILASFSKAVPVLILIGVLAGYGVRWTSREREWGLGRAMVATLSGLAVTFAAYFWVMSQFANGYLATDRLCTVYLAHAIMGGWKGSGVEKELEFPEGVTRQGAVFPYHFPEGVWEEAERLWSEMSPAEKKEAEEDLDDLLPYPRAEMKLRMFEAAMSKAFPVIGWFLMLQIFFSYQIGLGKRPADPPAPANDASAVVVVGDPLPPDAIGSVEPDRTP